MRAATTAIAFVMVASCSSGEPVAADSVRFFQATGRVESESARWTVSPEGIGPVRFGMSPAAIAAATEDVTVPDRMPAAGCGVLRVAQLPEGASLAVNRGTVVRVDVTAPGVRTEEGLGVGDSEIAVMVLYSGQVTVEPARERGPPSHRLIVSTPDDSARILLFRTDGSSVTSYHAGFRSAVESPQACP